MAILRAQVLQVHVFCSPSLLDVEPDVSTEEMAVSVSGAVSAVMRRYGINLAAEVYVRSQEREMWLHDVILCQSGITYEFPVERSISL
ncbi:hypothetical protein KDA_36200 [Dictyobacter alpinus]|uniref:Uncharacterized protein n=1 Tax=Dictyobacter alpinus TaxID=2014873 RepID=A0A402B9Y4_9CHLR|nr:hypothetical protein [Dictyobacter alpinus]GCE28136.1 hypothetical protein KDA_36200 [Dictyobacter alpinus]